MASILDIKNFKKKIISLLKENEINKILEKEDKKSLFSKTLELFVHLTFDEEESKKHWQNIFENYAYFNSIFSRNVGLRIAIFDYFINLYHSIDNPILVEFRFLKEAEKLAMIDSLTGVFNRRYFDDALNRELKRASRFDKTLSLLLIDVDNFKIINDEKGHQFGDELLSNLGNYLDTASRDDDIVCRYGGEEFMIILPEITSEGALSYAEKLKTGIKKIDFFKDNKITFSGGIATYPYDGREPIELIKNADKALYLAKYSGKDSILKSNTEKRRYKRFDKFWKFYYQKIEDSFGNKIAKENFTKDASLGGICFEAAENLTKDSLLLLDIKLPDKDNLIIVGEVAWKKEISADLFLYGVHFHDTNKDRLDKMKKILNE